MRRDIEFGYLRPGGIFTTDGPAAACWRRCAPRRVAGLG
jgi:hypothetical protein